MPGSQNSTTPVPYDARWFIWTIVFLVVTGISLVSYIVLSDTTQSDVGSTITFNQIASHKIAR